jgi:uncharacterized iron-regulated membrane protein
VSLYNVLWTLHRWTGLAAAAFLLVIGVTGSILEFGPEALQAHKIQVPANASDRSPSQLWDMVEKAYPGARLNVVTFPVGPDRPYVFSIFPHPGTSPSERRLVLANQHTGTLIGTQANDTFQVKVGQLHKNLLMGPKGAFLVAWSTVTSVFLILTGVILWWRRKIWRISPRVSWRRVNFDLHSMLGIYGLLVFLGLAATGIMMSWHGVGQFLLRASHQPPRTRTTWHSRPIPGGFPLSLDEIVARAGSEFPGVIETINMPRRAADPVLVAKVRTYNGFRMREPMLCFIDAYSGEALGETDFSSGPWAAWLNQNVVLLHYGWVFGWVGRIIAALASTAIPVMTVSGVIIWWQRKAPKRSSSRIAVTAHDRRSENRPVNAG